MRPDKSIWRTACPRVIIARRCSGSRQYRRLVPRDTKKRGMICSFRAHFRKIQSRLHLPWLGLLYIYAVNVRGCVSRSASLFNHAAVVLVTLNYVSRYDPQTITPICFVTAARMIIADTKNILPWRSSSTHRTHSGVTNLGDMTATWRCDEAGYCGRVWRYVNVKKKKDSHPAVINKNTQMTETLEYGT